MAKNKQIDAGQLSLFGEAVGLDPEAMPEGVSELDPRELKFVQGLLSHGRLGQAAFDAGYGKSQAVAAVKANELMKRPHVARFYARMLKPIGADARRLITAKAQLSIVMNGKAMDAAREADEKLAELRECEARQADKVAWFTEHKLKSAAYARAEARERLYTRQANEVDTLLASLLGKLSLNITETSTVKLVMGNEITDTFWQAHQRFAEIRKARAEARQN